MKNICQFQPSDFKEQYDELIETEEGRYLAGGEGALTNMNCSVLFIFLFNFNPSVCRLTESRLWAHLNFGWAEGDEEEEGEEDEDMET